MNDDFNTAVVVAHLNEESRGINSECAVVLIVEREIRKIWLVRLAAFKFVAGNCWGCLQVH